MDYQWDETPALSEVMHTISILENLSIILLVRLPILVRASL
jgi:hypothetical protein